MFSFLITRSPKHSIHIISYHSATGSYVTICGKTFKNKLNILAADNVFPGICHECKTYYEKRYSSFCKHDPVLSHHPLFNLFYDLLDYHRYDIKGPKDSYEESMDRESRAIKKYKRLLKKRK